MELEQLLKPELVKFDLESSGKGAVISELIGLLGDKGLVTDVVEFTKVVMAREEITSTGVGMGIAIPHGKSKYVKKPAVVFGKSLNGIEYDSLDDQRAKLFFLIAVPEDSDNEHLKILSLLSRRLMHDSVRDKLDLAESYEDVISAFK